MKGMFWENAADKLTLLNTPHLGQSIEQWQDCFDFFWWSMPG